MEIVRRECADLLEQTQRQVLDRHKELLSTPAPLPSTPPPPASSLAGPAPLPLVHEDPSPLFHPTPSFLEPPPPHPVGYRTFRPVRIKFQAGKEGKEEGEREREAVSSSASVSVSSLDGVGLVGAATFTNSQSQSGIGTRPPVIYPEMLSPELTLELMRKIVGRSIQHEGLPLP
jgi:hypothetical protein